MVRIPSSLYSLMGFPPQGTCTLEEAAIQNAAGMYGGILIGVGLIGAGIAGTITLIGCYTPYMIYRYPFCIRRHTVIQSYSHTVIQSFNHSYSSSYRQRVMQHVLHIQRE